MGSFNAVLTAISQCDFECYNFTINIDIRGVLSNSSDSSECRRTLRFLILKRWGRPRARFVSVILTNYNGVMHYLQKDRNSSPHLIRHLDLTPRALCRTSSYDCVRVLVIRSRYVRYIKDWNVGRFTRAPLCTFARYARAYAPMCAPMCAIVHVLCNLRLNTAPHRSAP